MPAVPLLGGHREDSWWGDEGQSFAKSEWEGMEGSQPGPYSPLLQHAHMLHGMEQMKALAA